MNTQHPFLKLLCEQKPKTFSVILDGIEIYKGEITETGVKTLVEKQVPLDQPRYLMSIVFDQDPTPVYFLDLQEETG